MSKGCCKNSAQMSNMSSTVQRVSNLRIVLVIAGTRGDVQPCVSLARELLRRGHAPLCVASSDFAPFCDSYDVPFRSLGVGSPPYEALNTVHSMPAVFEALGPWMVEHWGRMCDSVRAACEEHGADLVLATTFALSFARDVASALALPIWGAHFFTDLPTSSFAPAGYVSAPDVPGLRWLNFAKHLFQLVGVAGAWRRTGLLERRKVHRAESLGLPRDDPAELHWLTHTPGLFAVSALAVPWPADYGSERGFDRVRQKPGRLSVSSL